VAASCSSAADAMAEERATIRARVGEVLERRLVRGNQISGRAAAVRIVTAAPVIVPSVF
jgi:hypothetical protein